AGNARQSAHGSPAPVAARGDPPRWRPPLAQKSLARHPCDRTALTLPHVRRPHAETATLGLRPLVNAAALRCCNLRAITSPLRRERLALRCPGRCPGSESQRGAAPPARTDCAHR